MRKKDRDFVTSQKRIHIFILKFMTSTSKLFFCEIFYNCWYTF